MYRKRLARGLSAQNSFGNLTSRATRSPPRQTSELIHHHVDRILQLKKLAFYIDCDFLASGFTVSYPRS